VLGWTLNIHFLARLNFHSQLEDSVRNLKLKMTVNTIRDVEPSTIILKFLRVLKGSKFKFFKINNDFTIEKRRIVLEAGKKAEFHFRILPTVGYNIGMRMQELDEKIIEDANVVYNLIVDFLSIFFKEDFKAIFRNRSTIITVPLYIIKKSYFAIHYPFLSPHS